MQDWMNQRCQDKDWLMSAHERYARQEPFPHLVVDDWLTQQRLDAITHGLASLHFTPKESDLFSMAQTPDLSSVDEPRVQEFVAFLQDVFFTDWVRAITGQYVRSEVSDLFGAIYQDTDYLLCHDDELEDRKVAFILYLTTLDEQAGGALALYDEKQGHPHRVIERVRPKRNRLALFTVSKRSWHEVEEVKDAERVSIGGWLLG